MTNLPNLSVKQLRKVIAIKEKIEALEAEIAAIAGAGQGAAGVPAVRKKRRFSAATRAKLAARAKARWAKAKAAGRSGL